MTTPPTFSHAVAILDEIPAARTVQDGRLDILAHRVDPLAWARGLFGDLQPWMDEHLAPFTPALAALDADGDELASHAERLYDAARRLRAEAEVMHHSANGVTEAWSGPAAQAAHDLLIGQREADDAAARAMEAWGDSVLEFGWTLAAAKVDATRRVAALVLRLARDAFRAQASPAPVRTVAVAGFFAEGTREIATCLRETISVLEKASRDAATSVESQRRLAAILASAADALTTGA